MNGVIQRSRKGIAAAGAATGTKPTAQAVGRGCRRFANPGRGERSRGHHVRWELWRRGPTPPPPFFRRCRGSGDVLSPLPIACAMGWDLPPLPRLKLGRMTCRGQSDTRLKSFALAIRRAGLPGIVSAVDDFANLLVILPSAARFVICLLLQRPKLCQFSCSCRIPQQSRLL